MHLDLLEQLQLQIHLELELQAQFRAFSRTSGRLKEFRNPFMIEMSFNHGLAERSGGDNLKLEWTLVLKTFDFRVESK